MKTIILSISILSLVTAKAWAVCQEDDTACYCAHHPGECDDAPPPTPDYSALAAQTRAAAIAGAHAISTAATPLDAYAVCDLPSPTGHGFCHYGFHLWTGGFGCDVEYGLDGWGSWTTIDVDCGIECDECTNA
jgi:hypothetical protein